MIVDGVQVVGLILPKFKFNSGSWVFAIFQSLFRFKFEDRFDLFGPGHDAAFEDVSFILFGSFGVDDLFVGKRKQGPAFAQSDEDVALGNEVVESFHEVFGDKVGPTLLIVRILHDGSEHLAGNVVHMFKDIFGDLDEDDIVLEVLFLEFFGAYPHDDIA